MAERPPEARNVEDENTIIVHRTHDIDAARKLAHELRWLPDEPVPDWVTEGGEQVWVRTTPCAWHGDYAYMYRGAREGERGAFRAVVFSAESERMHWWKHDD